MSVWDKLKSTLPLYLVIFVDDLGLSLTVISFPFAIINSAYFVGADTSLSQRGMILGLLIAVYPVAQFLCAPLIGAFSDRHGRKPVLIGTLIVSSLAFAVSSIAFGMRSLDLLLVSRLIAGMVGSNIVVARASLIDMSPSSIRLKRLVISLMMQGAAWIVGPFLALRFYTTFIFGELNLSVCLIAVALAFFVCVVVVSAFFQETLAKRVGIEHGSIWTTIKSLGGVLKLPQLEIILFGFFLSEVGFFLMDGGMSTTFMQDFGVSNQLVVYVRFGLTIAFNIGVLIVPFVIKKMDSKFLIFYPLVLFIALAVIFPTITSVQIVIVLYFAYYLLDGFYYVNILNFVSKSAGSTNQGKAFGIIQSATSFSQVVAPLVIGIFLGQQSLFTPSVVSYILYFLSCVCFMFYFGFRKWLH